MCVTYVIALTTFPSHSSDGYLGRPQDSSVVQSSLPGEFGFRPEIERQLNPCQLSFFSFSPAGMQLTASLWPKFNTQQ